MSRRLTPRTALPLWMAGATLGLAAMVALLTDDEPGGVLAPYSAARVVALGAVAVMVAALWGLRPGRLQLTVVGLAAFVGISAFSVELYGG